MNAKLSFGTALYQLNHASIRVGIRRFQSVTWFGVVSYSKLKAEVSCPACHFGMEKVVHVGAKRVSRDVGDEDYESLFLDDELDDAGDPNHIPSGGDRFG